MPLGRESDLVHQTKSNNIAKSTAAHAMEAAAEMSRILAPQGHREGIAYGI